MSASRLSHAHKLSTFALRPLKASFSNKGHKKCSKIARISKIALFILFTPVTLPLTLIGLLFKGCSKTSKSSSKINELSLNHGKNQVIPDSPKSKVNVPQSQILPVETTSAGNKPLINRVEADEPLPLSPVVDDSQKNEVETDSKISTLEPKFVPIDLLKEQFIEKYGPQLVWTNSRNPSKAEFESNNTALLVYFSSKLNGYHLHSLENGEVKYGFEGLQTQTPAEAMLKIRKEIDRIKTVNTLPAAGSPTIKRKGLRSNDKNRRNPGSPLRVQQAVKNTEINSLNELIAKDEKISLHLYEGTKNPFNRSIPVESFETKKVKVLFTIESVNSNEYEVVVYGLIDGASTVLSILYPIINAQETFESLKKLIEAS